MKENKPIKRSFLRGWAKALILNSLEAFFWIQKKEAPLPDAPKRILLANTASFGDVVIATTVLPVLKKRYPGCEIGFLVSAITPAVVQGHPLVTYVHTIDHFFYHRSKGLFRAALLFWRDFRRVVQEIRAIQYDLAIDLYPHFFLSSIPIFWRANIEVRIGRFTKGFSNLLTHIAPPSLSTEYMGFAQLNMLTVLGIDIHKESPFPSYICKEELKDLPPKSYIVVHMGTGYRLKEWEQKKWIELIQALIAQGERVVLTGSGAVERERCEEAALATGCDNYCGKVSWSAFGTIVQQAKLLISLDSAAVHIASALQIPTIVLFAGISPIPVWKPPYRLCKALMERPPCSPCLVPEGCRKMSCIQDIQVKEVLYWANLFCSIAPDRASGLANRV